MRHYEIIRDIMRHYEQHETLRDIMDAIGLYHTGWDTDTKGDIVRQYETL